MPTLRRSSSQRARPNPRRLSRRRRSRFFQSFIEGLPKVVELGELTGGKGQAKGGNLIKFSEPKHGEQVEGLELAERAARIEVEKQISYSEALGLARAELQQQAG